MLLNLLAEWLAYSVSDKSYKILIRILSLILSRSLIKDLSIEIVEVLEGC
jgi:hypothetical protein